MPALHDRVPPLRVRHPRFDFSQTPLHWVPGDAFTSHVINVLSLIAPAGERHFMRACRDALPQVEDADLRASIKGFLGQEAAHAAMHEAFLAHLETQGIASDGYLELYERTCHQLFHGLDALPLPEATRLQWRLSVTAALEQITCVLGDWALDAHALDAAGADPTTLEFLRWHGAEEVEHRAVAFETLQRIYGPAEYPLRALAMLVAFPSLATMWHLGTRYFMAQDPDADAPWSLIWTYVERATRGRTPGWSLPLAALRFLDPFFHPAQEGRPAMAEAYFESAQAFQAAV